MIFTTQIPILIEHLNYGGHLAYNSVLTMAQEARIRWLRLGGMSEINITDDVGFFVTNVSVKYISEGFHGETVSIKMNLKEIFRASFILHYELKNQLSEKVIATIDTEQVFINKKTRKPVRTPPKFKAFLNEV